MESPDFYSDKPEDAPAETEQTNDDEEMEQTALIPKSLCPEMEAGSEITLKIEKVFEDEYLVSYQAKEKEAEPEPKTAMEGAEGNLERMARPPEEA